MQKHNPRRNAVISAAFAIVLAEAAFAGEPSKTPEPSMTGTTEKAFYAPGETMTFAMKCAHADGMTLHWTRMGDDGKTMSGSEKVVPGKPILIKASIDRPGFVRILASFTDKDGKKVYTVRSGRKTEYFFDGGAGVMPEKLSGSPEPTDFDAFWTKQKERLAAVPMKATMTKVPNKNPKVEVYAVSVTCAGPRPVTGYLSIPAGAAVKSLPASVHFEGYGGYQLRTCVGDNESEIVFHINAHGYELGHDTAFFRKFWEGIKSNGQIYAFDPVQNSNPETAYFNGMSLRVMRALEFVKSLPQWDGKQLRAAGESQGALQATWAASLVPGVTTCDLGIIWCCDLAGVARNKRLNGWRPAYVPALDYYDAANHAKRIPRFCPVTIARAGLGDYTCPPSGLAIFYNNLKTPKKIVWYQGTTHGYIPPSPQTWTVSEK